MWIRFVVLAVAPAACCAQTTAARQPVFEFHSGFWINLHQFLSGQAAAAVPERSDSPEWKAATEYYRREVMPAGEMSEPMIALNDRLSAAGSVAELPEAGLDPALRAVLIKAAAPYRRDWWPRHDRSNRAWIDAVQPLLAKHAARIRSDLAAVYRVTWPAAPIRTDVAVYAGPHGAYTTSDPNHITISSSDPQYAGLASLEMLFHEASHLIDEKLRDALRGELATQKRLFVRRGFSHAILFYTAGELTRRYVPGYEPHGIRNGTIESGWPGSLPWLRTTALPQRIQRNLNQKSGISV